MVVALVVVFVVVGVQAGLVVAVALREQEIIKRAVVESKARRYLHHPCAQITTPLIVLRQACLYRGLSLLYVQGSPYQ